MPRTVGDFMESRLSQRTLADFLADPGTGGSTFRPGGGPDVPDFRSWTEAGGSQGDWSYAPTPKGGPFGSTLYDRPFTPSGPGSTPETAVPAQRVSDTGEPADDEYTSIVKKYLEGLQSPVHLPHPPPLTAMQAIAVTLNPDRRQELMQHFREPYNLQMQEMQMNQARTGQAATMANALEQHRQQLELKKSQLQAQNYWKNWTNEQAAANSGNVDFPYTIPGMREAAQGRSSYWDARRRAADRSNQPHAAGGRFKDKASYLAYLDSRLEKTRDELLTAQSNVYSKDDPAHTSLVKEIQDAHDYIQNKLFPAIRGLNEQPDATGVTEYQRFQRMSGDEQEQVIQMLTKAPVPPRVRIIMEGAVQPPYLPSDQGGPPEPEQEESGGLF